MNTNTTSAHPLAHLFKNNDAWVSHKLEEDPEFFSRLAHQQAPEYLWIGCADSRSDPGIPVRPAYVFRTIGSRL